jgi:hypothetical protein
LGPGKEEEKIMGLYRRKNSPIWWMSFCVDKRRYQLTTGTTDKKLAEGILAKVKILIKKEVEVGAVTG